MLNLQADNRPIKPLTRSPIVNLDSLVELRKHSFEANIDFAKRPLLLPLHESVYAE